MWRPLNSLAKLAGLTPRGPHGVKGDAVTHALAKPDARPDMIQRWADHNDSRRTATRRCGRRGSPEGRPRRSAGWACFPGTALHLHLDDAVALVFAEVLDLRGQQGVDAQGEDRAADSVSSEVRGKTPYATPHAARHSMALYMLLLLNELFGVVVGVCAVGAGLGGSAGQVFEYLSRNSA